MKAKIHPQHQPKLFKRITTTTTNLKQGQDYKM